VSNQKDIDWPAIEADYRAGIKPLRAIADDASTADVKVSEAAIRKHAKACGWERDLEDRIAVRREALVRKQEIAKQVAHVSHIDERREVEIAAQTQANVIIRHKSEIGRCQALCDDLLTELSAQAMNPDDLAALAELSALSEGQDVDEAEAGRKIAAFQKLLKLGDRADTFRKLVEAKTKLVTLERQAFGIKDSEETKVKPPVHFFLNMAGGSNTQIAVVDGKTQSNT